MNSIQISKVQFSSNNAGSALLIDPQRVTFIFSGTISGGQQVKSQLVPYTGQKYFSSAIWNVTGQSAQPYRVWAQAPRSAYLTSESTSPTPRIYLSKTNTIDGILVQALITNVTNTSFSLSGTHTVNVDVYVFGSNILY